MSDFKTKYIKRAAFTAIAGNAILALLKVAAGTFANSSALVADGLDSTSDVLISIVTLVVVRIMTKPADKKHPYGYRRAETVATAFLSFVLFFAGAQIIINSVHSFIANEHNPAPGILAVIIAGVSIIGKIALSINQRILGKKANSPMIMANAKNMMSDVLVSAGVLVGLAVSMLTHSEYADKIIAILIGGWIIKTAVEIFSVAFLELLDGNKEITPYRVIVEAVNVVEGANSPHRARMRNIGGFWEITFDIDVAPDCSVADAHVIASNVEHEIKQRLENVFDIIIHVEPIGDDEVEPFGLNENEMME